MCLQGLCSPVCWCFRKAYRAYSLFVLYVVPVLFLVASLSWVANVFHAIYEVGYTASFSLTKDFGSWQQEVVGSQTSG